ncbi:MAG: hypothetical protein EG822_15735 [Deltaproteobacteria bacterium]|nr:hypothetical protein [Deltaproteobacteria bacterium]TLN03628.1 MAG: hypothetical protein FDZ73_07035 [bacterium]
MECERTDFVSAGLDAGLIGSVVREFAGASRNVSSYPQGHPVVVQSCERTAEMLSRLCADREAIRLGVARESLLTDDGPLENLVPISRSFVRALSHHGVALLTCRKGVTAAEIEAFSQILAEKRAELFAKGGIEQVVREAGIRNLEVCCVQYDAFQSRDSCLEENGHRRIPCHHSLWGVFVERFLQEYGDSSFAGLDRKSFVSSEALAGMVNSQPRETITQISALLVELIRNSGEGGQLSPEEKTALEKIGEFVGGLKPELRRQFFDNVLELCRQQEFSLMEVLPYLPTSAARELLTRSQENNVVLPPHILESMKHLTDALMLESAPVPLPPVNQEDRLAIVFREEIVDEFVPAEYLETLKKLVTSQNIPVPCTDDFRGLVSTLADDRIESAVSKIILESLSSSVPEQLPALKRNLHDLFHYFVEVGDFHSLENMYARLGELLFEDEELDALKEEVLETFLSPEFLEEVLYGVENWGKEKFSEIGDLIQRVGEPFVEPLLDRLAGEERLTFRRYYLGQLLKMADKAKVAVCARLGDSRWYFIRNLVSILEHTGDRELLVHLRKLAGFPHPKARQRVIEAFLSFEDPEGDRLLLLELLSRDTEARQSAIQLCGRSRSPEVAAALINILEKRGMSPLDFLEKKSAIQALAEIGDSSVFFLFDRMLKARHFLHLSLWRNLKKEIVCSLGKYEDPSALLLLQQVAKTGQREIATLAAQLTGSSGGNG